MPTLRDCIAKAAHPDRLRFGLCWQRDDSESLDEFEKFANQKLKTGKLPVRVVFLPMRPDQVEAALTEGLGDVGGVMLPAPGSENDKS